MREQIKELVERHLATIRAEAVAVDADLRALASGGGDLDTAIRRAHTLKGSSGSLGFAEISAAAELIEHGLRGALAGEGVAGIGAANARLQTLAAHTSPEDSILHRRFA